MSKKKVSNERLNAFVANNKADEFIVVTGLETIEKSVTLSKVVLRKAVFKHPAGVPFYAFVKQAGEQAVLIDVVSGGAKAVANHDVAAQANVRGRFKIDGVTYDKADTIHGMPRYKVVDSEAKPHSQRVR